MYWAVSKLETKNEVEDVKVTSTISGGLVFKHKHGFKTIVLEKKVIKTLEDCCKNKFAFISCRTASVFLTCLVAFGAGS
uniref:Ovule protein n=1 Tax=Heterorhabditis bacteriophora TaxID=37862 RepID=A0A1I7XP04_HETBA